MAHAQKPDLVFQRNGRVHLYRRGCQFSRLLAAEVCASPVVMLDRPCSDTVHECWLPTPFASFPFTSPPVLRRVPSDSVSTLPKKFYIFRSSFHAETCESPTLSGVVTVSNSETLVADVLSFLTMGKGVLCHSWASELKVFSSKQRTVKHSQTDGCGTTILLLEEKRNLKIFSTKIKQDTVKEGVGLKTIHPNIS